MEIAKKGYREDLKQFFRSKMEANIARYFNLRECKWKYEPVEYFFNKIKRGQRYYKPDFILYYLDTHFLIEVKGWFRANGEMIKFLCDDLGIDFDEILSYKEMGKYSSLIPGWE